MTLHLSPSFSRRPNQKQINDLCKDPTECLTSDLSTISDWVRKNLVWFNVSKNQFLHLSTRQNLLDNYPFYFNDTHLSLSSTLNILGLSFTKTINWKSHISSLAKSASNKLGVLCRLHQFFSLYQLLLTLYRGFICPCMGYISHIGGKGSAHTHTQLLNKVESKAFCRLTDSSPLLLTVFNLSHSAAMLHLLLSSINIFMLTVLLNLLTACLSPSHSIAAHNFLLTLIPILSTFLMQELTIIFTLSSLLLVNLGTLLLNLYFQLWLELVLKRSIKTPVTLILASLFYYSFFFRELVMASGLCL